MGSIPYTSQAVRVFIAGGAYGGLSTAVNLLDLSAGRSPRMNDPSVPYKHHESLPTFDVEITIAEERDGYYNTIGSPLVMADSAYAKKNWVQFVDIPGLQHPNVHILQGSVAAVDPAAKTATVLDPVTKTTQTVAYDYFVGATGLRRAWPVVPQSLTRKQYLIETEEHIHAVHNARHGVVVVGGGAVGIEMAAELKMVRPDIRVTLVHSREKLLSSEDLPDEMKDRSLELLREAGVEVLMNHRLASTSKVETLDASSKYDVEFTNGSKLVASQVVMAISKSVPSTEFLPASALDAEGYVKILPSLNFEPGTPNNDFHYAVGDIIKWSGIKRCGAALHQGHYVSQNIHQSVLSHRVGKEPENQELQPMPPMMGLSLGKKAVAYSLGMGTISGEDVEHDYFRGDLGWTICWNYMQLGTSKPKV